MGKRNLKLEKEAMKYLNLDEQGLSYEIIENQKKIEGITKAIQENKNDETKKDLIEKLQKEQQEALKKRTYLNGTAKNKVAIIKIMEYQKGIDRRIEKLKDEKSANSEQINENNAIIEEWQKEIQDLEDKVKPLVNDIENEEFLKPENQKAYFDTVKKIDELKDSPENSVKSLIEKNEKLSIKNSEISEKIESLEVQKSKCDLAWKSLFKNKTWDEIQVIATHSDFTRKKPNKDKDILAKHSDNPVSDKIENEEKNTNNIPEGIKEPEGKNTNNKYEVDHDINYTNLPAKVSIWNKILHPIQTYKQWQQGKNQQIQPKIHNNNYYTPENSVPENNIPENNVPENNSIPIQENSEYKIEKDPFLEGLRVKVEGKHIDTPITDIEAKAQEQAQNENENDERDEV